MDFASSLGELFLGGITEFRLKNSNVGLAVEIVAKSDDQQQAVRGNSFAYSKKQSWPEAKMQQAS